MFARRDMLSEAIDTNYEQFRNIYLKYELNWSQTEALRLVLWLAAKAYPMLSEGIDITNATKEVLAEKLTRLWGLKLGRENSKEAFSDRWIMAALSDFSGQLQARDIVRFLKYATNDYAGMNMVYPDRLIMPLEIRNAILPCSEDKLEEIKSEMKNIYEILQKFMEMLLEQFLCILERLFRRTDIAVGIFDGHSQDIEVFSLIKGSQLPFRDTSSSGQREASLGKVDPGEIIDNLIVLVSFLAGRGAA